MKLKDKYGFNWLFLISVCLIYFVGFLFNYTRGITVGKYFIKMLIKTILPMLIIVYFFIFIFNLLIEKDFFKKFLQKKNYWFKLLIIVILGIISGGPVYLRYPFLKQLKEKGLTFGHIAAFIYARAIKIPLIPMMIVFFGIKYTLIFNLVILGLSFLISPTLDILYKKNKSNNNITFIN